jgi:hypothetical protein
MRPGQHQAASTLSPATTRSGGGFDLILFAGDAAADEHALAAGFTRFVVDWEWRGKGERQSGADTEINHHSADTLRRLTGIGAPQLWCRLNRFGEWTPEEVETALAAGATHLLLPMVERAAEAGRLLALVDGRAAAGILVETMAACAHARELACLPLALVYVGLNDLAISRGRTFIFEAVADGTVEWLRRVFRRFRFGFGGMTVVDGGWPVPARLLLGEMARLDCDFTFLRRSFKRDVAPRDWRAERESLAAEWAALRTRSRSEIARDHAHLLEAIRRASA